MGFNNLQKGDILETYVVRIFRKEKNKPRSILGVAEKVGVKGKKIFITYDELWSILKSGKNGQKKFKSARHIVCRITWS